MPPETPVLDYGSPAPEAARRRPRRLLSHARTAALLCLVAVAFHVGMGFRGAQRVALVEFALAIYGTVVIIASVWVGGLLPSDKVWVWCCGAVYLLTLVWLLLVPALN